MRYNRNISWIFYHDFKTLFFYLYQNVLIWMKTACQKVISRSFYLIWVHSQIVNWSVWIIINTHLTCILVKCFENIKLIVQFPIPSYSHLIYLNCFNLAIWKKWIQYRNIPHLLYRKPAYNPNHYLWLSSIPNIFWC